MLLAPTLNLDATVLTLLVVQAFGAAAIGRFSSLPLTYVGGLVVGIVASVATKYVVTAQRRRWPGCPASIPFIVLFLVLIFTPRSKLADRRVPRPLAGGALLRRPARVQVAGAVIVGAVLLIVPHLVNAGQLPYWSDALTQVVLFLSLGLLVRTSGQVSLCQAAFAAIGATTMGHLTAGFGLPWGVALLLAGLAAVPVGAFIAIPAIRLPGVFLALATFGFAVTMEQMGYPLWIMFGSSSLGQAVNRPSFAQGDIAYYYLMLAFAVVASLLVVWLVRSRLGRLLRGMADSPVALATHGTSVMVTRRARVLHRGLPGRHLRCPVRRRGAHRHQLGLHFVQLADPAGAAGHHAGPGTLVRVRRRLRPRDHPVLDLHRGDRERLAERPVRRGRGAGGARLRAAQRAAAPLPRPHRRPPPGARRRAPAAGLRHGRAPSGRYRTRRR